MPFNFQHSPFAPGDKHTTLIKETEQLKPKNHQLPTRRLPRRRKAFIQLPAPSHQLDGKRPMETSIVEVVE